MVIGTSFWDLVTWTESGLQQNRTPDFLRAFL